MKAFVYRILSTIILLVTINAGLATQSKQDPKRKPNILFLFADDMTYQALGMLNKSAVKTPNLDRLAKRGVLFTHTFNQGSFSAAVCAASRAMIITGANLWNAASYTKPERKGKNDPQSGPEYAIEQRSPFAYWPQYMKNAGYDTYFTGKWHISADPEKLFDHTVHIRPGGMPNQTPQSDNRKFIEGGPDGWSPYDTSLGGFWKGGKHWSEVAGDDVIDFLNQSKSSKNPFFMYIGFNAPHDPRQSPKEYVDMYPMKDIVTPETFLPEYPYALAAGAGMHLRDERLAPLPRTTYSVRKGRQEYFALITHLDAQIGRILDELERTGQADNTYVFFTADHGLGIGDHGFMGKQNMYDASIRVPLIVAGPKIPENKKIDDFVYLQDVMPTALELGGVKDLSHIEFHSLMPLATGKSKKSAYPAIYGAYYGTQRMIRTKRYKMIIYPVANIVRLYDLKNDPGEMNDLAALASHRKTMDELFGQLKKLQAEMHDPVDVTTYYDEFFRKHPGK